MFQPSLIFNFLVLFLITNYSWLGDKGNWESNSSN